MEITYDFLYVVTKSFFYLGNGEWIRKEYINKINYRVKTLTTKEVYNFYTVLLNQKIN